LRTMGEKKKTKKAPKPGLSVGWAARSPARPIRPIDLRARPIRVKRALIDRPW
jgi:hypothetical protein